jgi:hypothetical protein
VELPNGAKFRAQGEVAEVRVDVERFYALLNGIPKPTIKTENAVVPDQPINGNGNGHGAVTEQDQASLPAVGEGLNRTLLDRLFSKDKHGTVSLRALPRGESAETDAMVALIYGSSVLANEPQVTGSRLMKAAEQSGLRVERIDRTLSSQIGPFVTTAGFKKGRRYGLTNPGIRRAEEILTAILG